ncbi:MAG: hypothetical protein M3539_00380 [Acidobacteriota bacterium]|nr:hypothetical protein [Acidobacteriota bacterium]
MKIIGLLLLLTLSLTLTASATAPAPVSAGQLDASHLVFWQKFRDAVIKGNKPAVASMSQFPISMPYGMAMVRNRAQLLRRYRQVFNHEGSAAKCFESAKPNIDPARLNEFTVGCKNAAGDEVVIYSFTRKPNGWKFTGLDNINE